MYKYVTAVVFDHHPLFAMQKLLQTFQLDTFDAAEEENEVTSIDPHTIRRYGRLLIIVLT